MEDDFEGIVWLVPLTHWTWDKKAAIWQIQILNSFCSMKIVVFWFKFHKKHVPKCPVYNKQALVQIMIWHQTGDKPSSGPMVAYFNDVYMWHSVNESKSCHAEFVFRNMKIYLHILSIRNTEMVLLVEIHAHGRRRPTHFSCKVNIRDADDLETPGARTSAAMVLT